AWLMLVSAAPVGHAQAPSGPVSFINDVAPILKENCFACHDAKKKKGKFEMTSYENIRKGGTKDDPLVPGKARESIIIDLLTSTGATRIPHMEAGEPLPMQKIAVIARRNDEGAMHDARLDDKADLLRELRVRRK